MTIEVYLDPTKTPPVTVVPQTKDKDKGKGTIAWKPGKQQDFTFISLTFANNPPSFGAPDIKSNGKEVTVEDDNSGGGAVGDFPYTIVVSYNGKQYSSVGVRLGADPSGPIIRNKPN